MRIALVSLDQAWEDKATNRCRVAEHLDRALTAAVDLVIFPEMTLTGFSMDVNSIGEAPDASETVDFVRELATGNAAIAFGVVHIESKKGSNKLIVVGHDGRILAQYRKMHLFTFAGENQHFKAGDAPVWFELKGLRIGCTICYDLRFPALYQALARHCNVIINIANWPESRIEHWETLLHARAIENQVFMIGVNRKGMDGHGNIYCRSSKVYGPSGEIVLPAVTIGDVDIFDLERTLVEESRRTFPTFEDRRDNLYEHFYSRSS